MSATRGEFACWGMLVQVLCFLTALCCTPASPSHRRHEYCVAAISAGGKGGVTAPSTQACTSMRVFWESTLHFNIVGKGTELPVGGVTVDWNIEGTTIAGTVTSNGAGLAPFVVQWGENSTVCT